VDFEVGAVANIRFRWTKVGINDGALRIGDSQLHDVVTPDFEPLEQTVWDMNATSFKLGLRHISQTGCRIQP
jgi:hypothetical protein